MLLSICSPVYRAEKIIPELVRCIEAAVKQITEDYEIILVEDCSPDGSWEVIKKLCESNRKVVGVKFAKNSGQHNAITAALTYAKGEYVVVMDCDLQDDPKYIPELLAEARKGYHIVYTSKYRRKHSTFKNITGKLYGYFLLKLTGNEDLYKSEVGSYSLLSRKAVDAFLLYKDVHRHYLMILRRLGFKCTTIRIEHQQRYEGKSSYNFIKLLNHAIDGVVSQSNRLLYLSVYIGLGIFALSFLFIILLIVLYFMKGFLSGWTSIMVMLLLSIGLIMLIFGIHGLYIGKIFDQVKQRPLYIVEEKLNYHDEMEETRPNL
ncbi:MAG: glycosyltransferase family 2 protein [Bacteroidia bacterium]|nr:glycosyltransferase family 2 protein [Bacteroidia bacterium]